MTDKKQVPPPFASPVKFSEGPIPVVDPRPSEAEQVVTTLFEDASPASTEPPTAQAELVSERKVVEQTEEQMSANVDEYWLTGTIGGLSLGNKSGAAPANPFKAAPANPKNPFQRTDKVAPKVEAVEMFDLPEGTPQWRDVVKFVMDHGKDIAMVKYPKPPLNGEVQQLGKGWTTVIDTLWRGVPVIVGPECEIQHVKYGWAKWEDCQ